MTGRYGTQDAEYRADVLRYNGVEAALRTIISDVEHGIDRITRHQAPAAQAAAAPTPTENTMQLSQIANDIKGAIENADQWVKQVTENHLPAILAQAQKYENSPIVQALEGAFLPPAMEQQIANLITEAAKAFPQPQAPEQPAQPVQA